MRAGKKRKQRTTSENRAVPTLFPTCSHLAKREHRPGASSCVTPVPSAASRVDGSRPAATLLRHRSGARCPGGVL